MSAACTGTRTRPQYQEMRVNTSSDAGNATGKAKVPKVFLRLGYTDSCRIVRATSQLMTAITCASGVRLFPSAEL